MNMGTDHNAESGRGLDALQRLLDQLAKASPTCRNAWCGYWERDGGVYVPHTPADHSDGGENS